MTAKHPLEPVLLLLAAGIGIGLVFPISKLADLAAIEPFAYIGWSAAGACLILFTLCIATGRRPRVRAETVRYALRAGAVTYAIPFGTLAVVVPHLGTSIPSIFQSLTAILTLGLVTVLGLERPGRLRTFGLVLGLVGVLIIIAVRDGGAGVEAADQVSLLWVAAALVTPLSLAYGNVYRSMAWPQGESPLPLATLTFACAAVLMLGAGLVGTVATGNAALITVPPAGFRVIVFQALATGIGYAFFFRLQQVGGPVYLSQISYVNTAVGLGFAVVLFGEAMNAAMISALALIVLGVALVNRTIGRLK